MCKTDRLVSILIEFAKDIAPSYCILLYDKFIQRTLNGTCLAIAAEILIASA
jgi:hypothetical protein